MQYAEDMARGWESKAIEAQQEEASRPRVKAPPLTEAERIRREKRRTLELARARALHDLNVATVPEYRSMLEQAVKALDDRLRET